MKLSPSTLATLKNFSTINTSLLIKPGNLLRTESALGNIHAFAKLEDEFPVRWACFDLNRFLGTLSLFDNPDIQFKDKYLIIEEGQTKTRFVYADEMVVIKPPEGDVKTAGVVYTLKLEQQQLQALLKAAGVMLFEDISFQIKEGSTSVVVHDQKNQSTDEYRINLAPVESAESISFSLKIENLKMMPAAYTIEVHKTLKGKYVLRFFNDKLTYWVATQPQIKSD